MTPQEAFTQLYENWPMQPEYRKQAWRILKSVIHAQQTNNTISQKLFDNMEQFAIACERADNKRDAREVRSWIKQLRASVLA